MKKLLSFALPAKALAAIMCGVGVVIFLLMFFLSQPPTEFRYVRTETAEVVDILVSNNPRNYRGYANARVQFENGAVGLVPYQTRKDILIGQSIKVDVLTADGEKPRYRLAQDPIQP